ncbi:hypothetical protein DEO72_LG2g2633 [Vigna unguiculata]|uniref:Uncharacterized protein n=1 Tax=Vigna unguiculata TaxID=3917 RepID=A0A4D6L1D7_VIGUN|nr:hypothetical protein DEO72_LG2g2633 [Vigna unguiculata]
MPRMGLAPVRVAARGVSQILFGATSSPIEDPFGVSFILVAMYVDDGAGVSVVDIVNGGEASSIMVVQAAGCTEKMTLANSDELQRRRKDRDGGGARGRGELQRGAVVVVGREWCCNGGFSDECWCRGAEEGGGGCETCEEDAAVADHWCSNGGEVSDEGATGSGFPAWAVVVGHGRGDCGMWRLRSGAAAICCTLWDEYCKKFIQRYNELPNSEKLVAGEDDSLCFPDALDVMLGCTFAFKVRTQPRTKCASVIKVSNVSEIVAHVKSLIPPLQIGDSTDKCSMDLVSESSSVMISELRGKSICNLAADTDTNIMSLSATGDNESDYVVIGTPGKRLLPCSENCNESSQDMDSAQLSSTKMKKLIKKEKT